MKTELDETGRANRGAVEKEDRMAERVFTAGELASFDGKDGRAAYVAYNGKVYDVTGSILWEGGEHQDEHSAGVDLTDDMYFAPHAEDVLENFPTVGSLAV
jgi:predicted heme/steroid binding protein